MQTEMNSPILKSISAVYEKREELFKHSELLSAVAEDLRVLTKFFGKDRKTAALLSVLVCNEIMDDREPVNRIMRIIGFDPLDFISVNLSLAGLRKEGWIALRSGDRHFGNNNEFTVASEVIDAVIQNDPGKLAIPVPGTLPEILSAIRRIIRAGICPGNSRQKSEFLDEIGRFAVCPFVDMVLNDGNLSDVEKIILFSFSAEFIRGQEEFDLNSTLGTITGDSGEARYLLGQMRDHKSALLRDGYLRFANAGLADFSSMALGEKILAGLGDDRSTAGNTLFVSKFCQVHDPAEIRGQELFFNPGNQRSVDEIKHFTAPGNFAEMERRFAEKGMKPGLTMLFYGLPGTGKTELVRQIARLHGRAVLQVEISQIKNKWVGESEKNLKRVFQEYQAALKHFIITPILFFNEADGILGERKPAMSSVDQMLNAMQNILLQELEDFQGIFIATTNLISGLDKAFDRRMLYKLNFQTPDKETRYRILKNEFPGMTEAMLQEISGKYALSGGQIQNIRKKFLVDDILAGETAGYNTRLHRYIEEETCFRTPGRMPVGFRISEPGTD